jgi:putative membrane protein
MIASQLPLALALVASAAGIWFAVAGPKASVGLTAEAIAAFLAAGIAHAWIWRGARFTLAWLIISLLVTFTVETIGVASGAPFGAYAYNHGLGPKLLGVPLLVPIAWTMMVYPAQVVAWRCTKHRGGGLVLGALALTAWDLLLDPIMVRAGLWTWEDAAMTLAGIPVTNFVGWAATAFVLLLLLRPYWPAAPHRDGTVSDLVPLGLFGGMAACLILRSALDGDLHVALLRGLPAGVLLSAVLLPRQDSARGRQREPERVA